MKINQLFTMLRKHTSQHFLLVALVSFLFSSCEEEKKGPVMGYSGAANEVVIVANDDIWNGAAGDTLKTSLQAFQYGLPQDEPRFKVIQVTHKNFAKIFQSHRNIIFTEVSRQHPKAQLEIKKDVYAKGQLFLVFRAPSNELLAKIIDQNKDKITNYIANKELDRLIQRNVKFGEKTIATQLENDLNIRMILQKDCQLNYKSDSVYYLRIERTRNAGGFAHQISQGIIAYSYPYEAKEQFLHDSVYSKINETLKRYVPGPGDSSFMTVEFNHIPPIIQDLNFNNAFAVESRGLWKMQGAYMGGPYYSMNVLDEKNHRIIGLFGFVFAPKFEKLEYLKEVEAMIKSLQLPK